MATGWLCCTALPPLPPVAATMFGLLPCAASCALWCEAALTSCSRAWEGDWENWGCREPMPDRDSLLPVESASGPRSMGI